MSTTAPNQSPTSSAAPVTPASNSALKKFTHAQILDKVAKRSASVPEYEQLLMDCRVRQDAEGVIFDSQHPSWHMLLHLCNIADTLEKETRVVAGSGVVTNSTPIVVYARDFPLPPQRLDHIETRQQGPSLSSTNAGSKKTLVHAASAPPVPIPSPSPNQVSTPIATIAPSSTPPSSIPPPLASSPAPSNSSPKTSPNTSHKKKHGNKAHPHPSSHQQEGTPNQQPPHPSEGDEWINVKVINKPSSTGSESPPVKQGGHSLSSAASSLFSHSTMSKAASVMDRFSKIITARPNADRRSSLVKQSPIASKEQHANHATQNSHHHSGGGGGGSGKSSSNSSRDVQLVKEDLDFESMLHREYAASNQAEAVVKSTEQSSGAAPAENTEPGSSSHASTTTAAVVPTGTKDAELLSQFLVLIDPSIVTPDIPAIKAITKVIGIPHKHRGQLWNLLLGVRASSIPSIDDPPQVEGKESESAGSAGTPTRRERLQSIPSDSRLNTDGDSASNGTTLAATATDETTQPPGGPESTPTTFNLHNQRVIRADIERTLPHLHTFQRPEVRHDMEVILTQYCKRHNVSYKQGMNYVLAPLFLLNLPNRDAIYLLYEKFIEKLLNNTFSDTDFGSLQCTFLLFKMSLQYHDPELALFLDHNDMGPELYASSWFITLFSNRCKMSVLFYLWDCLILDNCNDQQLAFWVSLALLIHNRTAILSENIVMLPESLSKLTIHSKKDASTLVNRAKKLYRAHASETCRKQLQDFTSRKISMDSVDYHKLLNQTILLVSEEELVKSCYGDIKLSGSESAPSVATTTPAATNPPIKFFILDCRPLEQYEAGHLPCAYHLDPDLLQKPADLADRVESLSSMKGCHFCFLGEGGERPATVAGLAAAAAAHPSNASAYGGQAQVTVVAAPSTRNSAAVKAFIQVFLKKGFKYLSNCESGYAGCHALILASDHALELIDHNQDICFECTGRRAKSVAKKQSFMANVRNALRNVATKLDDDAETIEEYQSQHLPDSALVLLPSHSAAPNATSPLSANSAAVGASSLSLKLLFTVIRDKTTDVSSFADALHRITAILVASFLERVEVRERTVSTGAGSMYTGMESTPVCTITVNSIALELLDSAFHPFRPVCKRQSAEYRFESLDEEKLNQANHDATSTSADQSASTPSSSATPSSATGAPSRVIQLLRHITVPSNLLESNILLFFPILTPTDAPMVFDILADLIHTRGVHFSQITLVSILAARPILWKLYDTYPDVLLLTSCVDELTPQNRLLPGISSFEERYNMSK